MKKKKITSARMPEMSFAKHVIENSDFPLITQKKKKKRTKSAGRPIGRQINLRTLSNN